MTIIIGLNNYHGDSSACILKDGIIIAASEEERFNRIKHWAGLPMLSIEFCMNALGVDLNQVDHIAVNSNPFANLLNKGIYTLKNRPNLDIVKNSLSRAANNNNFIYELNKYFNSKFNGKLHRIEHHYAHSASSFFVSPFDKSVVLSIDGFGDFASTAWGYANNNKIRIDDKVYFPHSLGIYYQAITQWLGFKNYGDEFKVMGLSAYGKPIYKDLLNKLLIQRKNNKYELNLKYFIHHKEKINYCWNNSSPYIKNLYSNELIKLLGPERLKENAITEFHKDIAASMQAVYEDYFYRILDFLIKKYKIENLCLAGGCAMNSVANGKIHTYTNFKNVFIPSAAGDAGGAIGSALSAWINLGCTRNYKMTHSYYGPKYDLNYINSVLEKNKLEIQINNCEIEYLETNIDLVNKVSRYISNGLVVGWFQGNMEWGSRALGNRSILCDPRIADMQELLNKKIKKRESFRPFAPSILKEYLHDWFEDAIESPFMTTVLKIKNEKKQLIPAVTHIDGTGRLQTVSEQNNKKYYDLISSFNSITGIPMLLNTSFNENEPIVCTPEQALDCFLRTKMDILVLENTIIFRKNDDNNHNNNDSIK